MKTNVKIQFLKTFSMNILLNVKLEILLIMLTQNIK